jgi:hypothetical protein
MLLKDIYTFNVISIKIPKTFLTELVKTPKIFMKPHTYKLTQRHWVHVVHACNPSYSGGRDEEDHSSKIAQAK